MSRRKNKHKRLFPNHMAASYVRTYKAIDTVKTQAYEIFQNHNRVCSTKGRKDQKEPIANNTFMQEIPRTKHLSTYDPLTKTFIPTPRRLSLERKMEEKIKEQSSVEFFCGSDRLSGFTSWNYFVVEGKGKPGELRLYFSRNRWKFVCVFLDSFRYSNEYSSKEEALIKHRCSRIFWAGEKKFPPGGEELSTVSDR